MKSDFGTDPDRVSLRVEKDGSLTVCEFGPDMFYLARVEKGFVPGWCAGKPGTFGLEGHDGGFLANAVPLGSMHTVGYRPDRPFEALIEITPRCNRNCPHCFVKHDSAVVELSAPEWEMVFARLASSGVMVLHITGGEPLVRADILDIVAAAKKHHLLVHLDTNATLADAKTLEKLCALRLDALNVGFDGPCADVYAHTRAKADFEPVLENVKAACQLGIPVVFFFCMHKKNRAYLGALARLGAKLGVRRISIDPVQPVISSSGKTMPRPVCYPVVVATKLWGLLLCRVFRSFPKIGWDVRCNMGLTSFGIHADGKISPCIVSTCEFGNAATDDVATLWQGERFLKYANAAYYQSPCNTCFVPRVPWMKKRFLGKCLFDCRAEVYCRTGNPLGGNDFCVVRRVLKKFRPGAK